MGGKVVVISDADGCMIDSQPSMQQCVNDTLGHTLPMEEWVGWNTLFQYALTHTGQSETEVAQWLFADSVMYAPPCPGAQQLVSSVIDAGIDFGILTSRWKQKTEITLRWFAEYFPLINPEVIFLRPPEIEGVLFKTVMLALLKPNLFIEDKAELVAEMLAIGMPQDRSMEIALLDRPWNRWFDEAEHSCVRRFGSFPENYGLLDLRDWILQRWG